MLFIADSLAGDAPSPTFGILLLGVGVLIFCVQVIAAVFLWRRGGAVGDEADRRYATKQELERAEQRIAGRVEAMGARIDASNASNDRKYESIIAELRDISTRLGRQEGQRHD